MFKLSFSGAPETFKITLGFLTDEADGSPASGALRQESVTVDWQAPVTDDEVLRRVTAALDDPDVAVDRVHARLATGASSGVVSASSYEQDVNLSLSVHATKPALRSVELLRVSPTGTLTTSLGLGLWSTLDVGDVTRLRCNEGAGSLWDERILSRFASLRVLNLSHAGLAQLPGVIGALQSLQELRVVGNKLRTLPPELGKLRRLRVLAADSNELCILPGELRHCSALEELTLENNRLTSVLLDFKSFPRLHTLHLFNNPLEFLPEISPCHELRRLSVANLRVGADRDFATFSVELLQPTVAAPTMSLFDNKPSDALRPIFSLMLRRSSGHHQLLAGALRYLAEDPKNRDLMAKQESALQQLILMSLNENAVVVEQTCMTLTSLALHSPALADAIVQADLGSMLSLLGSRQPKIQLSSLRVLTAIGYASPAASEKLLSDEVLRLLTEMAGAAAGTSELRAAALEALGNLAFGPAVKRRLIAEHDLVAMLHDLVAPANGGPPLPQTVRSAALRVLAILGENDVVARVVGRQPVRGRGLRVLSMDGGGMKGMATVQLLRQLEARTGRRIHELFDLIVGTSTGGLLAVALGLRQFSLDECEAIYKVLGQQVFSRAAASKDKEESWSQSFYRAFHNKTQHVRAVVVGYKHDASVYEALLKDYCNIAKEKRCLSDAMIDGACLNAPKVALVSALTSMSPAVPFVFRNYELPPAAQALHASICAHPGSSKHAVWQAVRASSAAIYYLDDYTCGTDKFQDGAVVANNPAAVALQEARLLWPDTPIDVFVSLGTGSTPTVRRDRGMSSFVDTGNILIESATSVQRVHEALATTLTMVPNLHYFRFDPVDPRCSMELDEIDPEKWALLEAAMDEFIAKNGAQFDAAAAALTQALEPGPGGSAAQLRLGTRRGLVVVSAGRSAGDPGAIDIAAMACSRLPMCIEFVDLQVAADTHTPLEPPLEQAATTPVKSHPLASMDEQLEAEAAAAPPAIVSPGSATPSQPAHGAQAGQPAVVEINVGSALESMFSWLSPGRPAKPSVSASAPTSPLAVSVPAPTAATAPGSAPKPTARVARMPVAVHTPSVAHAAPSGSAAADGAASAGVLAGLAAQLAAAHPTAGIIHLALHSSSAGLVLRWQERLQAVLEPGPEAAELLRKAGFNAATTTLAQAFEQQEALVVDGGEVRVVSRQLQRVKGQQVATLLVQHTSPAAVLGTAAIGRLRGVLAGQLAVSSAHIHLPHIAALLKAGALAVVSPAENGATVEGANGQELGRFFGEFYAALQHGSALADALRRAGNAHPTLRTAFNAWVLDGGQPTVLDA